MIRVEGERVYLNVPVAEAIAFATGCSDHGYAGATGTMRRIVGELAIDELQYTEQWRAAAMLRHVIDRNWPVQD